MSHDPTTILIQSIKRLLRRGALPHLRNIVAKTHAADLSIVFHSLSVSDQCQLFDMIADVEKKGTLFSELDKDTLVDLLDELPVNKIVPVLEEMPSDDTAAIIDALPDERADLILQQMAHEESDEVEDQLRFEDDTAGRIMTTDYIALNQDLTVGEAIAAIQNEFSEVEMPFYLYLIDEYGKLVGVSSLRQLVLVPPARELRAIMTQDVFSVSTDMDQEEVAKIVARYDILAVPVVDERHCLVGIVTVDDVIDIFRREATEDILKMAGVGEEFVETKSVLKSTRLRLPWLFASCIGGILAFFIIGGFEESLKQVTYLAAFIPVIMGMGGNIGTQSSTIVVRGLATGRLNVSDLHQVVLKELAIGIILGLIYGIFIGAVAQMSFNTIMLAVAVCAAVLCSMSVAALVGSLVPMLFARINIDPAIATGPFVTTAIDIISVFFYFMIATALLGI
ncbi:MAG: magnesium transporter [Desulfosarcinaceae bacterium]|nr:magnesium transporter [Desulfosarcinaceae bacterium]